MPAVLFPGAGSELYRGLGSVVQGGLPLLAVPALALALPIMSFNVGLIERKKKEPVAAAAEQRLFDEVVPLQQPGCGKSEHQTPERRSNIEYGEFGEGYQE